MTRSPDDDHVNDDDLNLSVADLQRRRQAIRNGLTRANTGAVVVLVIIVALALAAIWQARTAQNNARLEKSARRDAQQAAREKQEQLWTSQLLEARSYRISGKVGQRTKALDVIGEAARWRPSVPLRNEAIAALLLPDIGRELSWRSVSNMPHMHLAFDSTLEHVSWERDTNIIVVRIADGKTVAAFPRDGPLLGHIAFSPDDRMLAGQLQDGTLIVWDWREGRELMRTVGLFQRGGPRSFNFAQDGSLLGVIDSGGRAVLFDLTTTEKRKRELPGIPGSGLRFSHSGRRVVVFSGSDLEVRDVESARPVAHARVSRERLPGLIMDVAWHPGDETLAVGCQEEGLFVWDLSSDQPRPIGERETYTWVSFNRDGDLLLASGWGDHTTIWDVQENRLLLSSLEGHAVALSADNAKIAINRERQGFGVRQFLSPAGLRRFVVPANHTAEVRSLDWHSSGRFLVTGHTSGVLIWNVDTARAIQTPIRAKVESTRFGPDGNWLLTAGERGVERWQFSSSSDYSLSPVRAPTMLFPPTLGFVRADISSDGERVAAAGPMGGSVIALDSTNQPVQLGSDDIGRQWIEFSPDGKWLVTACWQGSGVSVWRADNGSYLKPLLRGEGAFRLSPDGRQCLTATVQGYKFWDVDSWQERRHVLWGEPALGVSIVGWSRDGEFLVADRDGVICLIDAVTDAEFARIEVPGGAAAWAATFDPGGTRMALNSPRRAVLVFDLKELRTELGRFALDWPDDRPGGDAGIFREGVHPEIAIVPAAAGDFVNAAGFWLTLAGVAIAIVAGLHTLSYQRRLVTSYEVVEAVAAQRRQELERTQSELFHSQKMKALGTLAAGIAHDFNNLLSVIRLSNEFLTRGVKHDPDLTEETKAIEQAVEQGRSVVRAMLGYSKPHEESGPPLTVVADLVEETVTLLGQQFLSGIRLTMELDRDTPPVRVAGGRLEQILLNLVVNASEAMSGNGRLFITTQTLEGPIEGTPVLSPRPGARYIKLAVADSGPGISPEVLPRVFEPFFTTKTVGTSRGTGLGLSTVFLIAQQEGLGVTLNSKPGEGTTFGILIPVVDGRDANGGEPDALQSRS